MYNNTLPKTSESGSGVPVVDKKKLPSMQQVTQSACYFCCLALLIMRIHSLTKSWLVFVTSSLSAQLFTGAGCHGLEEPIQTIYQNGFALSSTDDMYYQPLFHTTCFYEKVNSLMVRSVKLFSLRGMLPHHRKWWTALPASRKGTSIVEGFFDKVAILFCLRARSRSERKHTV